MESWITPKQQEDLNLLNTYAYIKHNPNFKCDPRKKRIKLQQYREELIKRGLDMDKNDIMIFEKYVMGATFFPDGILALEFMMMM